MKKLISMMIVLIISISVVACNNIDIEESMNTIGDKQLTQEQKIQDFEQMFQTIEKGYPYLEVNKRLNNVDWIANKEKYLAQIKNTENDEEFIIKLNEILMELNNGHTHLINSKETYEFF
ncbi:MAG: hypothetical protein ACRCYC_05365 [Paraclostridium sp.]|uniref:hypothetical protein n=1 Tax=Paraclostridium sp. TaxID=2023273 RepID=UPI003F326D86